MKNVGRLKTEFAEEQESTQGRETLAITSTSVFYPLINKCVSRTCFGVAACGTNRKSSSVPAMRVDLGLRGRTYNGLTLETNGSSKPKCLSQFRVVHFAEEPKNPSTGLYLVNH